MNQPPTTVIYHSADFDGIFCREIARKFLPADTRFIGWNFGDGPLPENLLAMPLYILDLPVDQVFGLKFKDGWICRGAEQAMPIDRWNCDNIIWIDHHKSSIETHPTSLRGYRIDGVAACRLAWQWFWINQHNAENRLQIPLPDKAQFVDREVMEPWAVNLAGEYDIWDKRNPDAELFQHGLRSEELTPAIWKYLLDGENSMSNLVVRLLNQGRALQYARTRENESIIKELGFTFQWEGLTWLACNAARYNSHLFTAGLKPEHEACFGFKWTGREWSVSLYHAPGHEQHDLSAIAKKFGGGGHRGACGFQTSTLPFLPDAAKWKRLVQDFVGVSTRPELEGVREIIQQNPAAEEDKKLALTAIRELLNDLP